MVCEMRHPASRLAAIAALLSLVGCASVDPKPFEEFHASAAAFQAGTDAAYKTAYDMAAKGFATPSPFGVDPTVDQLVLTWQEGGDPTRPTQEEKPLHSMLRDTRRGSYDLNAAFAEYAQYLSLLAAGSAKDAETLEELAKSANANLRSARDALSISVGDDQVAIIATIGAEALRQKIEKDRRDYLRETMDEAQPRIKAFSDFMVLTMDLLAGDITRTYLDWAESQRRDYGAARRTAEAKRKILVALLERNDQTLLLLESVRTMRDGYARIPVANAEIRKRLDEREAFLAAVRRLYDDARRLQELQNELAKAQSA
jgi:hypothetical protein